MSSYSVVSAVINYKGNVTFFNGAEVEAIRQNTGHYEIKFINESGGKPVVNISLDSSNHPAPYVGSASIQNLNDDSLTVFTQNLGGGGTPTDFGIYLTIFIYH